MDKAHPDSSAERLCWFGLTDRGKVRKNNEDAFIALRFDAREFHHLGKIGDAPTGPTDFVFAVTDFVGIHGFKIGIDEIRCQPMLRTVRTEDFSL